LRGGSTTAGAEFQIAVHLQKGVSQHLTGSVRKEVSIRPVPAPHRSLFTTVFGTNIANLDPGFGAR